MQEMCWKIQNRYCACSVTLPAWSLATQCFRGRLDCARAMASGPGIGTVKWQKRRLFDHINRGKQKFPSICRKFMIDVVNLTTDCANTDCVEPFNQCFKSSMSEIGT